MVHRDLKPGNVVLTETGLCKLIDFGMSKEMQRSNYALTMVGTPQYMPPE